ncbi:hypothetical protein BX616_001945 [Lobosporangium transversale]|uniref:Helix-loop-helix DNA-binding domain-domain-containing protein n=1 Tax=Lobosporangium transversale TaxID=64571 RepID=A0A1Y2GK67_9FUNG|nr:helix-loop-helix DNA-binding domain-domain-containing protein [Lobosporangium transversale]KAF9902391.1 hypothetical protein BX616_001945 [Lobosporangium transversale]ORZ09764.1 helix-loop-helix DNA-binding domain-domain-containing protein [Lobosporangium transversale]|eukprot:XP_021879034.1 helix-loop-helix DNA-binding domain-domain-containing protein [Lobosporangium transversale]
MFGQQTTQQQPKLQFPTNYHLQQQQQQQQTQTQTQTHPMAVPVPMSFANHQSINNTSTPNNSFAGTIDPGLLQLSMNRMDMSQLQNMNSLFPPQSTSTTPSLLSNQALLARGNGLGNLGNGIGLGTAAAGNPTIKKETVSPDYLTSEMDFGEPGNMLSPGSSSPLNSPLNDFDGADDFATSNLNNNGTSSFTKPVPLNIQPGSYGESPRAGSLYSPGLESDFFPDGDFSLPKTRGLDMKFGRPMHPNSLPANPFHSMSMPVQRSDWFGGMGADGHSVGSYETPSGLHFAPGEMTMMDSLFEEGSDPKTNNRAVLLNEKRRRRRESHNAVERRRRDNINEKIQELSTLLPDCYIDSANKPNKGVILRKSVDYIRHLQQLVASQSNRNQELEAQLQGKALNMQTVNSGTNNTGSGLDMSGGNGANGTPQLQQGFGMMRIVPGSGSNNDLQN